MSVVAAPPRAKPQTRIIAAQAGLEWRLMMANGVQLLLTLVIPVTLLVGLTMTSFVSLGANTRQERLDLLVPGVIALAIMSSAFTALAIATGFDRRSEAIKFLGTTPLTRTGLLAAKALAVLGIQALQFGFILGVAAALGWRPGGSVLLALPVWALGTFAFASLALAMAGVLRAEATLAAANAAYVLLLLGGGVIVPTADMPGAYGTVVGLLPSAALADGLRAAVAAQPGAAGAATVQRWFRWTSCASRDWRTAGTSAAAEVLTAPG
jgi:ABC-2 type transport system permease protein